MNIAGMHGAYDRVPGVPKGYTSASFARGWRRYIQWPDWFTLESWNYEHNIMHHAHPCDEEDPNRVNVKALWGRDIPLVLRYVVVAIFACTWKFYYHAPNAYRVHVNAQRKRDGRPPVQKFVTILNPFSEHGRDYWRISVLPYVTLRFIAVPLMFLPLGRSAVIAVALNSILAELFTNLHGFIVIGPNHTADDVYRFTTARQTKNEYFARQVLGAANYYGGTNLLDFLQIHLNYHIEHHLMPNVPMLQYQRNHQKVREMCEAYGLPYTQSSVFDRCAKFVDVMVGRSASPQIETITAAT